MAISYSSFSSPFQIREEPPPPYSYSEPQSRESFENPVAGSGSRSYESDDEEPRKSTGTKFGTALYDFTAGGDDEVSSGKHQLNDSEICGSVSSIRYYLYGNLVPGKMCYDASIKTHLGMLQLNLTAEEELEIEYEVDGWFYVSSTWLRETTRVL